MIEYITKYLVVKSNISNGYLQMFGEEILLGLYGVESSIQQSSKSTLPTFKSHILKINNKYQPHIQGHQIEHFQAVI